VGGNVGFYNESFGEAIFPTPVVGMLGLLEDADKHLEPAFANEGDTVVLLGETKDELGGSEYLKIFFRRVAGQCPSLDLDAEKSLVELLVRAVGEGLLSSAHDLSEGGLGVALAESCILGGIGATVKLQGDLQPHVETFSESQSRAIVSLAPEKVVALEAMAAELGVPLRVIGKTGGKNIVIEGWLDLPVEEVSGIYETSLERMVAGAHH